MSVACAVGLGLGAVILLGWITGVRALTLSGAGDTSTKANTALALMLAGAALGLRARDRPGRALTTAGIAAAGLCATIGAVTLLQYVAGVDLRIDQIISRDSLSASPHPGRMAPQTALSLIALGLALVLLGRGAGRPQPARWLAAATGVVASVGLMGYLTGVSELYGLPDVTQMSLATGLGLLALSIGCILAFPERGGCVCSWTTARRPRGFACSCPRRRRFRSRRVPSVSPGSAPGRSTAVSACG